MSSFQDLVDLSFGGPEDGQVNFNALHSLLHAIVYKLKLSEEKALIENETIEKIKEHGKNYALLKSLKESVGANSFVGLAERLKNVENFWNNLNALPSNEIIIKTTEANVPNLSPLTEMWEKIRTAKTVEACEKGIEKILCMMDDLMKFAAELDHYNKELLDALLGPGDETGNKKPMTLKEAIEELGNIANQFERNEAMMNSITERLGEGTLPTDEFFDNLPTWALLEQLMEGKYENVLSGKEKRELGEIPLSENMKRMLAALGAMVAYNDELLARVQTIENNLQYLTDRAATKADIQKLNVKMAEVQGIASAVDRLLCRIQGSEDQLCCLRQVINKIYGCISNNANQGSAQGVISCLGGKGEGAQIPKNGGGSGGGGGGGGGGGVNDNQLKLFIDQLTKVECEMDSIKRNLVSVDGIKVDVQNLFSIINELDENKLDKCLLTSVLAHKADKSQVEDKVSQSCFENTCTGLSSVINDILNKILENDTDCRNIFNHLEKMVQMKSDREEVEALRDQLEAKLRCMAKNFMGLQKFFSEEGDGDDSVNFKRNVNQNQNDAPTPAPQGTSTLKTQPPPQSTSPAAAKAPLSLPLNPGLSGNKIIRQFPLMIRGTEFKGVNPSPACGVKLMAGVEVKVHTKKNSVEDFKPNQEICRNLLNGQGSGAVVQQRVFESIPVLPEVKDFVSTCQQKLSETMNTLRACSSGTKLSSPCKFGIAEKDKASVVGIANEFTSAKLADKTVYSALLIGSDQRNQLTMDFENSEIPKN